MNRIKTVEIRNRRGKVQILRFCHTARGGKRLLDITDVEPDELEAKLNDPTFWRGTNKEAKDTR